MKVQEVVNEGLGIGLGIGGAIIAGVPGAIIGSLIGLSLQGNEGSNRLIHSNDELEKSMDIINSLSNDDISDILSENDMSHIIDTESLRNHLLFYVDLNSKLVDTEAFALDMLHEIDGASFTGLDIFGEEAEWQGAYEDIANSVNDRLEEIYNTQVQDTTRPLQPSAPLNSLKSVEPTVKKQGDTTQPSISTTQDISNIKTSNPDDVGFSYDNYIKPLLQKLNKRDD